MDKTQTSRDDDFSQGCSSVQNKRSEPEPSCVSMKSDQSMVDPVDFKSGDSCPNICPVEWKESDQESRCVFMKSDGSIGQPLLFKSGDTQSDLSNESNLAEVLNTFRTNLAKRFQCLYEGAAKQGSPTLLNEIYTELYIIEGGSGEIFNEHEVRQIETLFRRTAAAEDTPIKCNDIFKPLPEQDKPIRTVLTKGVAGIGKTISVWKFIADWAERKANQDVHLLFPLPFRELNLMKDKKLSLSKLLHVFFPEIKEIDTFSDKYKVLFIFDGLDECRLAPNFQTSARLTDVSESASVDALLMNLIMGNLLPSAHIWITSRPASADLIPSECVHRVTEIRGFNDPQKEEYFKKRISNLSLANAIIKHLKSTRSLHIMCHIPMFCWISATVLEKMLSQAENREIPKTLTQMYTHFLIIQTNIKHVKDYETKVKDQDIIVKLGKLLSNCGVTDEACFALASVLRSNPSHLRELNLSGNKPGDSGVKLLAAGLKDPHCKLEILKLNDCGVTDKGCATLASALRSNPLHLRHLNMSGNKLGDSGVQLLSKELESPHCKLEILMLINCGVTDEGCGALASALGLNPSHLRELNLSGNDLGDSGVNMLSSELKNPHCKLKILKLRDCGVTDEGCAALTSALRSNPSHLRELNLSKNKLGDSGVKLIFVELGNPHCKLEILKLWNCGVTDESCDALASALRSNPSHLRHLDLSHNKLDLRLKLLSDLKDDSYYKLERLYY